MNLVKTFLVVFVASIFAISGFLLYKNYRQLPNETTVKDSATTDVSKKDEVKNGTSKDVIEEESDEDEDLITLEHFNFRLPQSENDWRYEWEDGSYRIYLDIKSTHQDSIIIDVANRESSGLEELVQRYESDFIVESGKTVSPNYGELLSKTQEMKWSENTYHYQWNPFNPTPNEYYLFIKGDLFFKVSILKGEGSGHDASVETDLEYILDNLQF